MSLESLQNVFEGKIDFEGQRITEFIIKYTLILSSVASFLFGFATQSLFYTCLLLAFSTVVLFVVVVPPWSYYNTHPVQWLPRVAVSNNKGLKGD